MTDVTLGPSAEKRTEGYGLVIGRKPEEQIFLYVGDEKIEITLIRIRGEYAHIGIKADKDRVKIHRSDWRPKSEGQG